MHKFRISMTNLYLYIIRTNLLFVSDGHVGMQSLGQLDWDHSRGYGNRKIECSAKIHIKVIKPWFLVLLKKIECEGY